MDDNVAVLICLGVIALSMWIGALAVGEVVEWEEYDKDEPIEDYCDSVNGTHKAVQDSTGETEYCELDNGTVLIESNP